MAKYKENPLSDNENKQSREVKYLHLLARIYAVMILAVYPLCVGFSGYDNIVHSKAVVFWIVSVAFFVVFALFYAAYRLSVKDRPLPFWKTFTIPDWAALAFLLALTISFLVSPYKDIAWSGMLNRNDGYLTYFCMVMSYFILSRWYKPQQTDMVLFAASSALVCVIGFLQFYGFDFMNLFPYGRYATHSGFTISFRSTIGNINFVSAYVCIAIVIFGALYIKTKHNIKYLYLAASTMNFILMTIARSDSGTVGLLGTMVLLVPFWVADKKSFGKLMILVSSWGMFYVIHHGSMAKLTIPYLSENKELTSSTVSMFDSYTYLPLMPIFIASLMLLCAGIILLLPKFKLWPGPKAARITGFCALGLVILIGLAGVEVIGGRLPESNTIHQAREVMHGNMQDSFGSGRGYTWRKSLEQFADGHPLFGTGSDTFLYAFGEENQNESRELYGVVYDKAHNDYIQILLCNGIIALISYLALIFSIVMLSVKKAFHDDFMLVALGGAIAYMIQSFFNIDTVIVTPLYWVMLAIVRQRQAAVASY